MLPITPLVPGLIWCCNLKETEMQEMTIAEVKQVEGGMILPFAAGYLVGTLIYEFLF